jgi:adenine-specific DNA-methyltransferase
MESNIKKSRGQFFTTQEKVLNTLIELIKNNGSILEPSAGQGHIIKHIETLLNKNVVSIELDTDKISEKICDANITNDNFFSYINNSLTFDTVIGNPPFVKLKNVEKETINLLPEKIPANGNLYYYFIKYSVSLLNDDGELVFIVPKEWLYNVSAQFVRDFLSKNGNFTHFIDCGEEKLFVDADVPALCIFRYQKDYQGKVKYYDSLDDFYLNVFTEKNVTFSNTINFSNQEYCDKKISDYFDVKVGIVSGADKIFKVSKGSSLTNTCLIDVVGTNKSTAKYLYLDNFNNFEEMPKDVKNHLLLNKEKLMIRKINKFTEKNWWKYGALRNFNIMKSNRKRIYGIMKTRNHEIFWKGNENEYFGGGVVGLFLKENIQINLDDMVTYLNSDEFREIMCENNMCTNDKVSITPSVLSNLPINFIN